MVDRLWQTRLPDRIQLPGSTDRARYGVPGRPAPPFQRLARVFEYVGPAWYQRDIDIPYAWRRRRITLFLERCHWETRLWVDGRELGSRDSLSVPHVYDITSAAAPGRHSVTIRVDNRIKHDVGRWATAVSEESQTNWNGIVGRIELRATARVWIEEVRTYPDLIGGTVKVRARVGNITGRGVRVTLTHTLRHARQCVVTPAPSGGRGQGGGDVSKSGIAMSSARHEPRPPEPRPPEPRPPALTKPHVGTADCGPGYTWIEHVVPVPEAAGGWDEFSPRLIELGVGLRATDGETTWLHGSYVTFGMRSLGRDRTHFLMNDRRIYLRGVLECCVFPLTGYPPTDVESWNRIMRIARSYGLNHMRFHSWCPPEAAFAAADAHGVLLQVEAPLWAHDVGRNPKRDRFIRDEMVRILDTYGNHPSFGLFCIGNELIGDRKSLKTMVREARAHDPRHLYTSSTAFSLDDGDDYAVAAIRGVRGARTDHDFRDETRALKRPTIAHEIGQWLVFPDIRDMGRFTGVLRPANLLDVQKGLASSGLLPLAPMLVHSTGHAAVELYKEEIEVQLRNPDGAGFQLLSLQDFPGHGTATVGMMNALWESKGFVSPDRFRQFCSPTVPLARLSRRTLEANEVLDAPIEIAHYGSADLEGAVVGWVLRRSDGAMVSSGKLGPLTIPSGGLTEAGRVRTVISGLSVPSRLTLEVSVEGTAARNSWSVWVYPRRAEDPEVPASPAVAEVVTDQVLEDLRAGKPVVVMSERAARRSIKGSAVPVFWSPILFPDGPLTMGILCDPKHAALSRFPTDPWTDWQWHDILNRSRSMVIGDQRERMEPLVRVIDSFARNLPLALVAQARVGPGRLLVCGADLRRLAKDDPAARQLLTSLMAYAASDAFNPQVGITESQLLWLFPNERSRLARTAPPRRSGAVLHVRSAAGAVRGASTTWSAAADTVIARARGFDYKVMGSMYRDDVGSGWHAPRELSVTISVPKTFTGTLAVRFHDWNRGGRVAQVHFEGRFVETLTAYDGDGAWLTIPVTARDSADGSVVLMSKPEGPNDLITELMMVSGD